MSGNSDINSDSRAPLTSSTRFSKALHQALHLSGLDQTYFSARGMPQATNGSPSSFVAHFQLSSLQLEPVVSSFTLARV